MLVVPEQTYPLICVAVSKGTELSQVVRFGTVNPNSTSSWFTEAGENTARLCQVKPITVFFGGNSTRAKVILCLFLLLCRNPTDMCDPCHSARERHNPSLPRQ